MKFIIAFIALFASAQILAQSPPSPGQGSGTADRNPTEQMRQVQFKYDVEVLGRDTAGVDSVFVTETILEPIAGGWQQRVTYQLVLGAQATEAFLAQKEGEAGQRAQDAERQAASERQIAQAFRDLRMSKVAPLVASRKKELPTKKE